MEVATVVSNYAFGKGTPEPACGPPTGAPTRVNRQYVNISYRNTHRIYMNNKDRRACCKDYLKNCIKLTTGCEVGKYLHTHVAYLYTLAYLWSFTFPAFSRFLSKVTYT